MKIAVDISPLETGHKVRGVGYYVDLLKNNLNRYASQNEYNFFTGKYSAHDDVVHYPYLDPFFVSFPVLKSNPTVITVHDLTPIKFPTHFPGGVKGKIKWQINKHIIQSADAIITDSESSKRDIVEFCNIPQHKGHVVYLAVQKHFKQVNVSDSGKNKIKEKYNMPEEFFLYVGDATWNKNLPNIIHAVLKTDKKLVIAGKAVANTEVIVSNEWNKDLIAVQKMIQDNPNITVLGFIPTDDLVSIYNLATALLMPSRHEGFGLPVLEAMSCGTPVITSRKGSLPEVAGKAAMYVNEGDVDSIADAINTIDSNAQLQKELKNLGLEQAKKFSIEKMIQDTVTIYERVYRSHSK